MIKVIFKKIEKSRMTTEMVTNRLMDVVEKFPDLQEHQLKALVYTENTSRQAGPNVFGIKLVITGKKYRDIILEKKGLNFYIALAELTDCLLERLNRFGDKIRIRRIGQKRTMQQRL